METVRFVATNIFLCIAIFSCSQNVTRLSDEEKKWNPYENGDRLVFESSTFENDTIYIKEVEFVFPDGIGVVDYNQSLRVLAEHTDPQNENRVWETFTLILAAKTQKKSSYAIFDLRAKNAQFMPQRFSFDVLNKLKEIKLSVPYGEFSDVIRLVNNEDYSNIPTAIEIIFWSKNKGYIRFDKYDGTSWRLIEIIKTKKID